MCMTFKLPEARDGTVVAARSMEFPVGMPTQLAVLPADYAGTSSVGEGARPKTWTASHGVVGMGVFGRPNWLVDAINTAGVSAHVLYMPGGYCTYRAPRGDGTDVSQVDLAAYLLGTCASIDEVKAAVAEINVIGIDPGMGFVPPVHCLIHDRHRLGRHRTPPRVDTGGRQPGRDRHQCPVSRLAPHQPSQLPGYVGGEPTGRSGRGTPPVAARPGRRTAGRAGRLHADGEVRPAVQRPPPARAGFGRHRGRAPGAARMQRL